MFYSQFILAKKGPLGTIWIAAHLERKLRKNQVADTDIGVSVDSILFPDVPIALRLSSHLLLGVVRIYSRKVNYLFDDCSEALLKIKQAFRSTAVDLPPEESTAPYHSITLPETFDLDDFELPDNDIFQGNYVDHHISAREQITLQDTIEGVVYSTSQFGLDERFGDGDASQVGLDLEEDLFLDKVSAPEIGAVERTDHLMSDGSFPKGGASQEGGSSEAIPMNGTTAKFKDGIANSEFTDEAQAPSTPGLIEEPNLSTVQEGLTYYDNVDSEDHNLTEPGEVDIQQNASNNEEIYNKNGVNLSLGDPLNHDNMVYMPPGDNSCLSGDEKVNQAGIKDLSTIVKTDNVGADKFDGRNKVELSNNDDECINKLSMPSLDQMNGQCEQNIVEASLHKTAENGDENEKSDAEGENASNVASSLKLPCHLEHNNSEALDIQRLEDSGTLDVPTDNEKTVSTLPAEAVPCSVVTFTMEEELHDCGTSAKVQGDGSHMTDCILTGENLADVEKRDEHLVSQVDDVDNSQVIDVPAFEKLLAAPEILPDKPDDLVVESTPDKEVLDSVDGSVDGTKISGRKRSFTESTLTMETLNSAESFGAPRSKRTAEFIPDDDDLLSSILVGRKSSTLKMKPTPPAPEATSMKRSRSATKPSSMKRKLQMDDSMVLLGDVIREQLTNTEDIRRLRKKAPCTRAEILMIQRQFLEEEIFSELLLAGISSELAYVHGGTHDLSGIIISEVDDDSGFMKFMNHEGYSTQPMANQDGKIEHHGEPSGIVGQPADRASETENHHSVNHVLGINHDSVDANAAEIAGNGSSEYHASSEMCETRCDVGNAGIPGNSNHAVILEHDTSQPAFVSGDMNEIPSSSVVPLDVRDDPTSAEICLNVHNESVENVSFPRDMANGEVPDGIKILEHCSAIVPESMFEELPMIEIKDAAQAEIREDEDTSDFASAKEDGASLVDLASEMAGCTSSVNQAVDNIEYRDLAVTSADGSVTVDLGFIEKDEITKDFGNEESKIASTHLGIEVEAKDGFIDDPSQSLCQEVDQQSTMIIENTSLDHFTDGNFRDFEDTAMIHDTEFLNMEDDDDGEDECGVMNAEEARLLDNRGWSSRTRAVASYLQNLFEKEDGRRIQCVDNLLVGKTRKEASRMFFETLVLKTRDYIEVEQRKAFDDINIRARPKLMKSEF